MTPVELQNHEKKGQELAELALGGDFDRFEQEWLEIVESPPGEIRFYVGYTQASKRSKTAVRTRLLDSILLPLAELETKENWKLLDQAVGRSAAVWPESEDLRRFMIAAIKGRYAGDANLPRMLELCKIEDGTRLDRAIKLFRQLLRLREGSTYAHTSWGDGTVRELDLAAGSVIFDFKKESGKKLTIEGVRQFLTYLPPSHIRSRRLRHPEKLTELSRTQPVELIKIALRSEGRMLKQAQLKNLLSGEIMTASQWSRWWPQTKRELMLDAMIDLRGSSGASTEVILREDPKTIEEELREIFQNPDSTVPVKARLLKQIGESKNKSNRVEAMVVEELKENCASSADESTDSRAAALEVAYLGMDLKSLVKGGAPKESGKEIAESLADVEDYGVLLNFTHEPYAIRAFEVLKEKDGEKAIQRGADILAGAPVKLAQAIWKILDDKPHHELAAEAINELLTDPLANITTYSWAIKAIIDGNWNHFEDYFHQAGTVMGVVDRLDSWEKISEERAADSEEGAAAKALVAKMRAALSARRYSPLCDAAQALTLEQAQRMLDVIATTGTLSDLFKRDALKQIRLTRKELDDRPAPESASDSFEYCTARARAEKLDELNELRAVKIPNNSKAILEAREEGDLKENAGYHAAKDEQKLMMQQALQLQEMLSATHIIETNEVNTDSISFGTRFEAQNLDTDTKETYTVLGRWEADPERHVLSILAPLCQQFLTKKIGEDLTLDRPDGTQTNYRVLSIVNALESGEWDISKEK